MDGSAALMVEIDQRPLTIYSSGGTVGSFAYTYEEAGGHYYSTDVAGTADDDADFHTLVHRDMLLRQGFHKLLGTGFLCTGKLSLVSGCQLIGEGKINNISKITFDVNGRIAYPSGSSYGLGLKNIELEGAGLNANYPLLSAEDMAATDITYDSEVQHIYVHGVSKDGVPPLQIQNPERGLWFDIQHRDDDDVPYWTDFTKAKMPCCIHLLHKNYNGGNFAIRDSYVYSSRASDVVGNPKNVAVGILIDHQSTTGNNLINLLFDNIHFQAQRAEAFQGYAVGVNLIHDDGGGGRGIFGLRWTAGNVENLRGLITKAEGDGTEYTGHGVHCGDFDIYRIRSDICQSDTTRPFFYLTNQYPTHIRITPKNRFVGGDYIFDDEGTVDPGYNDFYDNDCIGITHPVKRQTDYDLVSCHPNGQLNDQGTHTFGGAGDEAIDHQLGKIPDNVFVEIVGGLGTVYETSEGSRAADHFHATCSGALKVKYLVWSRRREWPGTWP